MPRTQTIVNSDVYEWILSSEFFVKEHNDTWVQEGLEQCSRLAKFRNKSCAFGDYTWNFSKKDFTLEYMDGVIIWSRSLKYCFESDINYSDNPSVDYDETQYLSASSITLCSLFDESLQIMNNSVHISDSYEGDIDPHYTNYGPLGCQDCQIHGSYNGIFFQLCESCADLPGLEDDSISDEVHYINNILDNLVYTNTTIQLNIGSNIDTSQTIIECPICQLQKPSRSIMTFLCNHQFCGDCAISWLSAHQTCPLCRVLVIAINI